MNKFLTFAGIQPVYLGDIDFMQAAADNAVKQLGRSLMDADSDSFSAILQGVIIRKLSAEQVQYEDGIVVLNGEILPVTGNTISISSPSAPIYFHIVSVLSGTRTFKDGVARDCYETRSVIINDVSEGGVAVDSVPRLYHRPKDVRYIYDAPLAALKRRNDFWFFELPRYDGFTADSSADFSLTVPIPEISPDDLNTIPQGGFPGIMAVKSDTGEYLTSFRVMCEVSINAGESVASVQIKAIETVTLPEERTLYLKVMLFPD